MDSNTKLPSAIPVLVRNNGEQGSCGGCPCWSRTCWPFPHGVGSSASRISSIGLGFLSVDTEKAQRIAAEKGCDWSSRLDDALIGPDAVHAVIIASATDTHHLYIMALRADKAMQRNPFHTSCMRLRKLFNWQRPGTWLCLWLQRRADRHFRELKRQLDAGAIGNLKLLKTCSRDNPIPPMEYI